MLEPVGGIGKGIQLGRSAVAKAGLSHLGKKEGVTHAPKDSCRNADDRVGKFSARAREIPIPIDHARDSAGLGPSSAISDEIFLRESASTAGANKSVDSQAEVETAEGGFGEPWELEKENVPTAEKLVKIGFEETEHHAGMRDVQDGELVKATGVED